MARLIALDWDRLEARIIVARDQAESIVVDQVVTAPMNLEENNPEDLEAQLTKVLASLRVSKSQVLAAIGRSSIELRTLKLPPAPDEELPDMVRFQALREFSSLKEESPLDFLPLSTAASEPGEVMAAAIPLDLFHGVEKAVSSQGHESSRMVMRPCSAASLAMRRLDRVAVGVTLIIAQQSESVEVAVTKDGIVVFTRSFRLPANWHPGETGEPLLGEVRRTIVAAQNQLGGSRVDHVVLFGTQDEHGSLCENLKERTKLDVEILDPFEGITVRGNQPQQPERFAALLGMLHDEACAVRPVIDFKNPRKRPEAVSHRRQYTLYAATAATMVLALLFLLFMKHRSLNQEIDRLTAQLNQVSFENDKLAPTVVLAKKLNDWKQGDKNWLEELYHLSDTDELTPDDFRLDSLSARTHRDHQGVIEVHALAKDKDAQQRFQEVFTDEQHDVIPLSSDNNARKDQRYPEVFVTRVQTPQSIPIEPLPPKNNSPSDDSAEEHADEAAPAAENEVEEK